MTEPSKTASGLVRIDVFSIFLNVVVSFIFGIFIQSLVPDSSVADLHLAAVLAAHAAEPNLACAHTPEPPEGFKSKLMPAVTPKFLKVVGTLNRLAEVFSTSEKQNLHKCLPQSVAPPGNPQSRRQEVTR